MKANFSNKVLKKILRTIIDSVSPQRVILFGSRTRRDYKNDSDYDFMVIKEGIINEREVSRRIYRALFEKKIEEPVDIIVVDTEKLKIKSQNPHLIYSWALKEGKVLYG